jgi:uncharacterized protein
MGDDCRQYFMVEHNGDVYPCDFYAEPAMRLGNIVDSEWADMQDSPVRREFGSAKSRWGSECRACPFLDLCAGDCPRNRSPGSRDPQRPSLLCAGWRMFYEHSLPRFQRLARQVLRQRPRELGFRAGQGGAP